MTGFMKPGENDGFEYKNIFYSILLGLMLDRITISWMTNRFGCNYYKL
jgi:hypothetical protein